MNNKQRKDDNKKHQPEKAPRHDTKARASGSASATGGSRQGNAGHQADTGTTGR